MTRPPKSRRGANRAFLTALGLAATVYPLLVAVLLLCTAAFSGVDGLWDVWSDPATRFAARLSLITSLTSAALALLLAVPTGYALSRFRVPGWRILDILLYLPIVLPGLVVGVALLIFFRTPPGRLIERHLLEFTFNVPGIILAQTVVATAFATRIAKLAFDAVPPKRAGVARTLGAGRFQAFWRVELPEARRGLLEAFVLAWATAFGSFGPVILFCGTTRFRTEVLSTSIFLEFSVGNLDKALALSIWMAAAAALVLLLVRGFGKRPLW